MPVATDYNSIVFGKIDAECHLGHELHVMTSSAFNTRVLGVRLYRVAPSATGHIGYTKQGIMLRRSEIPELHRLLTEAMANDSLWDEPINEVVPIKESDNDE